ncbi:MAG: hypothetical protein QW614_01610 [Candidatus Caldarchaeum sp.]|uniref:Uncharacterized protein n=1 Tax=Caldiarchaeum subterraneum TaxID=311458 RepID=A0A7C5LFH5_CALS0
MRPVAILVLLLLGLSVFSAVFFIGVTPSTSGSTRTIEPTIMSTLTKTVTSTVTVAKTVVEGSGSIPSSIVLKIAETYPNFETMQTYHVWLPAKPGTYVYSFAVFWRYGENHSHIIYFHPPEGGKITFMLDSLIQTRFAAAKNIPNVPAPNPPVALLRETVFTEDGQVSVMSWDIGPHVQGYASRPQVERGGHIAWAVSYTPLEQKAYGESLVARYYFLQIRVTF